MSVVEAYTDLCMYVPTDSSRSMTDATSIGNCIARQRARSMPRQNLSYSRANPLVFSKQLNIRR